MPFIRARNVTQRARDRVSRIAKKLTFETLDVNKRRIERAIIPLEAWNNQRRI